MPKTTRKTSERRSSGDAAAVPLIRVPSIITRSRYHGTALCSAASDCSAYSSSSPHAQMISPKSVFEFEGPSAADSYGDSCGDGATPALSGSCRRRLEPSATTVGAAPPSAVTVEDEAQTKARLPPGPQSWSSGNGDLKIQVQPKPTDAAFCEPVEAVVSESRKRTQVVRDDSVTAVLLGTEHLLMTLLTMVDVRLILIKLADRLHTMWTLSLLPESQRREIASETLGIFVPLASRLGIWTWEVELEDLSFMYLYPEEHKKIKDELSESSRGLYVASALKKLHDTLREAEICFHDLSGRNKSLYSIFTKMLRKSRPLKDIFDVRGLRLIVQDVPSCFLVLDVVHQLWPLIPGKQKDYINHPKQNGYQSLHTVVVGEDGYPLEVQIRTVEMHHNAEFGMAAHWRYKQGETKCSSLLGKRIEWARWVLSQQTAVVDSKMRVSASGVDVRPPCPHSYHQILSNHGSSSEYAMDLTSHNLFMGTDKVTSNQSEVPLTCTAQDVLARVRMASSESDSGLSCWRDAQVETGHRAVDDGRHHLFTEDMVVEFKPFDKYRECIYGGT